MACPPSLSFPLSTSSFCDLRLGRAGYGYADRTVQHHSLHAAVRRTDVNLSALTRFDFYPLRLKSAIHRNPSLALLRRRPSAGKRRTESPLPSTRASKRLAVSRHAGCIRTRCRAGLAGHEVSDGGIVSHLGIKEPTSRPYSLRRKRVVSNECPCSLGNVHRLA
jgi:hypothetical protein